MWRKKSNAGRNTQGRIVVWTKSSIKTKLKYPKINYNFRLKSLLLITTLKLIPFQNKLITLSFLASGGITYLPATDSMKIFNFIYFPINKSSRKIKNLFLNPTLFLILQVKRLSKISLLELFPGNGIKFIRSSGSYGKLIKLNLENHTALIQLPSGVRKFFSIYSIASLGAVSASEKKNTTNTKSGFWRSFGLKPKVRGVARNPVDHPHGGRTKAIKYPRTPWGKTTKFK